jgi:hypothetical protein
MANLQQCSRCKSTIDISFFGLNRKKVPYKTCDNCRNKRTKANIVDVQVPSTKTPSFLEHYVSLPIIKLEQKHVVDMRLDTIVVLNHRVDFVPKLRRYDMNMFTYKEFTKLDSVEYATGVDPKLDYMPDEFVAPVLLKIDGVTYRASCLTWFPLTDCSDAIKLKQHETNQDVYPITIKKGKSPIATIQNATGYNYHERLPSCDGFILHQGYTDSEEIKDKSQ